MIIQLVLAFLPLVWGCIDLLQSWLKKDIKDKNSYKLYGIIKVVIGTITGLFLAFLYCSFDFFSGNIGVTIALAICWSIITLCNIVAQVKEGLDEYDKRQEMEEKEDPS